MLIYNNPLPGKRFFSSANRRLGILTGQLGTGKKYVAGESFSAFYNAGKRLERQNIERKAVGEGIAVGNSMAESAIEVADAMTSILERMLELSVEAQDPLLTAGDRANLNTEFTTLRDQLTPIAQTSINGNTLMDGTSIQVKIGPNSTDTVTLGDGTNNDLDATALGVNASTITTTALAATANGLITTAMDSVLAGRAAFSAGIAVFDIASELNDKLAGQFNDAVNEIMNIDVAEKTAKFVSQQLVVAAGQSVLTQAALLPQGEMQFFQSL